jgi:DNA replication protein DnaC
MIEQKDLLSEMPLIPVESRYGNAELINFGYPMAKKIHAFIDSKSNKQTGYLVTGNIGKTHMLSAICNYFNDKNKKDYITYKGTRDLIIPLIVNMHNLKDIPDDFSNHLILIDDIDELFKQNPEKVQLILDRIYSYESMTLIIFSSIRSDESWGSRNIKRIQEMCEEIELQKEYDDKREKKFELY